MRIFFSMQHLGSFLVYEPVVRELATRGHELHLAVTRSETLGWETTLEAVLRDHPRITWGWLSPAPATPASGTGMRAQTRVFDWLSLPHGGPRRAKRAEEIQATRQGLWSLKGRALVWFELSKTIRIWAGYLRYFDPEYASAPKLKSRAEDGVPPRLARLSNRPLFEKPQHRRRLLAFLRLLERAMPPVPEIQHALRDYQPDLVLI